MKRFGEALRNISLAIEKDPENPDYYSRRADYYFQLNEIENSIRDILRAIQLNPEYESYKQDRRKYIIKAGWVDEALSDDPQKGEYWLSKGRELHSRHKFQEAIETYSRGLKYDCQNASLYFHCALSYQELGLIDTALTYFGRALILEPENPDYISSKDSLLKRGNNTQ